MTTNYEGYWSRSWSLLTRDKGWFKPVLVLAAARFVPIVGSMGADGYALEWGRLTSWGVDSSPKQKGVDVPGCICTGARAFVVALGYALALAVVQGILVNVLGQNLGSFLGSVLSAFAIVVILVAQLRSAIYQTIGAGYQVNRVADMVTRDFPGLARVTGLSLVLGIVTGLIASVLVGIVMAANMGGLVVEAMRYQNIGYNEAEMASLALRSIAASIPALCIAFYLISVVATIANLIMTTSVGLWMRQFDVRNWGQSADPLPGDPAGPATGGAPYAAAGASTPASSYVPTQPGDTAYGAAPQTAAGYGEAPQTTNPAAQAPQPVATQGTQPDPTQDLSSKASAWEGTKATATVEPQEPAVDDALVSDIPVVPLAGYGTKDDAATAVQGEPTADEAKAEEEVPETIFLRDFEEGQSREEGEVATFKLDEVYGDEEDDGAFELMLDAVRKSAAEEEAAATAEPAAATAAVEETTEPAPAPEAEAEPESAVAPAEVKPEPAAVDEPDTEDEILAQVEKAIREATVEDDEEAKQ